MSPSGWVLDAARYSPDLLVMMLATVVVFVIPFVGRHDLPLGVLQISECPLGMSAELDPSIGRSRLLDVTDGAFSGAVRILEIGMMNFVSEGDRCNKNRAQRGDDNLFHDIPLQLVNAISVLAVSILDNPTDGMLGQPSRRQKVELSGCRARVS